VGREEDIYPESYSRCITILQNVMVDSFAWSHFGRRTVRQARQQPSSRGELHDPPKMMGTSPFFQSTSLQWPRTPPLGCARRLREVAADALVPPRARGPGLYCLDRYPAPPGTGAGRRSVSRATAR